MLYQISSAERRKSTTLICHYSRYANSKGIVTLRCQKLTDTSHYTAQAAQGWHFQNFTLLHTHCMLYSYYSLIRFAHRDSHAGLSLQLERALRAECARKKKKADTC
jgi:hypothetical protein